MENWTDCRSKKLQSLGFDCSSHGSYILRSGHNVCFLLWVFNFRNLLVLLCRSWCLESVDCQRDSWPSSCQKHSISQLLRALKISRVPNTNCLKMKKQSNWYFLLSLCIIFPLSYASCDFSACCLDCAPTNVCVKFLKSSFSCIQCRLHLFFYWLSKMTRIAGCTCMY